MAVTLRAGFCVVALFSSALMALGAHAAEQTISINVHSGRLIKLSGPATNVFVADPDVADVQVPSSTSIYVLGKKSGHTNVYALDQAGDPILAADVIVSHDTGSINALFGQEFPGRKLAVRSVPAGIILSGELMSDQDVKHAVEMVQSYLGTDDKVINQLSVAAPNQVNLRVRVAEMSRDVAKQLGFNWNAVFHDGNISIGLSSGQPGSATNPDTLITHFIKGNWDILSIIDALAKEGAITTLAEPNLTAISGETASFLAGGEFPIPVAVNNGTNGNGQNQLSIEFKQFGVGLSFTPTVLSAQRISLKVRPEVSQLSDDFSVDIDGIHIPGLQVRRAETTVELASGQSFAIAGLLDNRTMNSMSKVPGIGNLPVLGPLFQSSEIKRNENELMIIVTPYIVEPITMAANQIPTPVDQWQPSSDMGRIFGQHMGVPQKPEGSQGATGQAGQGLIGNAGFYY
jgi:pilus assembly protein CpaC